MLPNIYLDLAKAMIERGDDAEAVAFELAAAFKALSEYAVSDKDEYARLTSPDYFKG
jgi:hypothetical protein